MAPKRRATAASVRELLKVGPDAAGFSIAQVDPSDTHGVSKKRAQAERADLRTRLADLQERLYADGGRSLLIVLQGMDTAGKDGAVKRLLEGLNPQGVHLKSFKVPTPVERRHHFLWRIRRELPPPGWVSVFNRSQYEDVLVVRVDQLAPPEVIDRRYEEINRFEAAPMAAGTVVLKFCLLISYEEQRQRLVARLEDPTKWWKYSPGDIDKRAQWDQYQAAYDLAVQRCSTAAAPWYVVPADHKWFRDYAITQIVFEALEELRLEYPKPDFNVKRELRRLGPGPTR